jgi:hypothetical protein
MDHGGENGLKPRKILGSKMLGYLALGALIGALLMFVIYLLTRPYHEDKKDQFLQWKQKVLVLESWKDQQEAVHKAAIKLLNDQKDRLEKITGLMKSYEKSADQIHKDYVMLNCHVAAIERRYADLVPVHRHYYLSDEMIKIKRVTNERNGRTNEKVSGSGDGASAENSQSATTQFHSEANDLGRNEERGAIPSYSPPGVGAFGTR